MDTEPRQEYAARVTVDYSDHRDRRTVFFRPYLAIPALILIWLLQRTGATFDTGRAATLLAFSPLGIELATVLMIVSRRRYPRWWFDFQTEFARYTIRTCAYLALLRDEYPSTEEEQAIHIEFDYPHVTGLNRWLPLVKWLLATPHYIALTFLGIGLIIALLIAWLAILLTGRMPRGIFEYAVGVIRWALRVHAYAFLMLTDRYPPFSLK